MRGGSSITLEPSAWLLGAASDGVRGAPDAGADTTAGGGESGVVELRGVEVDPPGAGEVATLDAGLDVTGTDGFAALETAGVGLEATCPGAGTGLAAPRAGAAATGAGGFGASPIGVSAAGSDRVADDEPARRGAVTVALPAGGADGTDRGVSAAMLRPSLGVRRGSGGTRG